MNLTLRRMLVRGEVTEGQLSVEGMPFCQTLENSLTCLPAGRYPLNLGKCRQYARKMITVETDYTPPLCTAEAAPESQHPRCWHCRRKELVSLNTRLPRYCPMLKPGNGIIGRKDGSILLGTRTALGLLVHPRASFDLLYERLRKNLERGHEAVLVICD